MYMYQYLYGVKEVFIFSFQRMFHIHSLAELCDPVLKVFGSIHYFNFTVCHRDVFHWLYHYWNQVRFCMCLQNENNNLLFVSIKTILTILFAKEADQFCSTQRIFSVYYQGGIHPGRCLIWH